MNYENSTTTNSNLILDSNVIHSLNPQRSIFPIVGNLCKNPHLLRDTEIHLSEMDFALEFHKIIFSAIYNLAFSSAETKRIDEVDIDNYLASYPTLYKIWEKHGGFQYVRDSIEHSNEDTFRSNYDRLKKFSLLRFYVSNGVDVSDLYDYHSVDILTMDKGMKTIDSMTVQEIIEHYTVKVLRVRDEFNVGQESRNFVAGDDLDDLLINLNKEPEFGFPFRNGFYNSIFRGMRPGKFMLRSAGTGTGKTRQALADVCNAACDEIYDIDNDRWVKNGYSIPSLFISTELEKQEVQTIILAFVSGVNEQVIKNGHYSYKIEARLKKAIKIIKRMPLYCVYINDFSIADIEAIIEQYIIEHMVKIVAFDYIQITPKLSRSMTKAFGSALREDQILVQFSSALKILANKYQIFIMSSTQLNRSSKEVENRDTTALRGGSATADKVDHGLMTFKVTSKDLSNLKHILEHGIGGGRPDYSHWIYKNRSGLNNCIIWTQMDLGTMREIPLFVTDLDYNLLDISMVNIEYSMEDVEETNELSF